MSVAGSAWGGSVSAVSAQQPETNEPAPDSPVRYCLNTSTIRGQQLPISDAIDLAAAAGYDGIEPWIGEIQKHVEGGGTTAELRTQLSDRGLAMVNAIGFARWIVDDPAERTQGLEQAKRDMARVAELGGTRLAAPPVGAHQTDGPPLPVIAERYRALVELGLTMGVVPQLEIWGFSRTLSRLGELAYVATEAGHPAVAVLPDVYHIYKGGSDFAGLTMIEASRIQVFHMNDYPDQPPRASIGDEHRVYPGDGVAPLGEILSTIVGHGFAGYLSLELFNRDYWKQDARLVAETGLRKMRAAVSDALDNEP